LPFESAKKKKKFPELGRQFQKLGTALPGSAVQAANWKASTQPNAALCLESLAARKIAAIGVR
jgi:hypothetical protein